GGRNDRVDVRPGPEGSDRQFASFRTVRGRGRWLGQCALYGARLDDWGAFPIKQDRDAGALGHGLDDRRPMVGVAIPPKYGLGPRFGPIRSERAIRSRRKSIKRHLLRT